MIIERFRTVSACFLLVAALFMIGGGATSLAAPAKTRQALFGSPEEAVKSLIAAVRDDNKQALLVLLGPGSREIVSSGDPVADKAGRERFTKLYDEKNSIEKADNKAVLSIGNDDFPFPIPLVKRGDKWGFDAKAGKEEILNRRIGRNELQVIDVLRAYVDAQREYASKEWDGKGTMEFAQKISSTPGKKDGLYWPTKEGEAESPLGPLAAKAAREGYAKSKNGKPTPFHGYLFKILTGQGKKADGGAYDYLVNGRMVLGFAMVAYPAQYGSSGIMTFIVNQNGIVYQKNLGKDTARMAAAMKRYNPDKSWTKVE